MLRDSPGFYSYVILERLKGWPAYEIGEGRLAFKLNPTKYVKGKPNRFSFLLF